MQRFAVLFIVCFVLFVFPHGIFGDGWVRFEALQILFEQGRLSAMKYSITGPLFAIPLYALGYIVKNHHWWCARFNSFLFLGMLGFVAHHWKDLLSPKARNYVLLALVGATMFPKHLADFYGEVFTAVMVFAGCILLSKGRERTGWTLCILGAVNTPASLPALGLLAVFAAWKEKRPQALLAPICAGLIFLGENWLRFGQLSHAYGALEHSPPSILTYSALPGFSYPFFFGLLSLLISFGKGLLFFTPGIFLYMSLRRTLNFPAQVLSTLDKLCVFSIGLFAVYARWWAWSGDWFWGPRFFLLASIPGAITVALLLASPPHRFRLQALVLAVATLSFWVGVNGVAFGQSDLEPCGIKDMGFLCHYVPEFSVLWRPFVVGASFHGRQAAYLIFFLILYVALTKALWSLFLRRLKRRLGFLFKSTVIQKRWEI